MFVLRVQVGLVILMFWAVCGSEQIGPRGQHDYFSCRSSDYGNSSRWLWFSLDRIEWVVFQIPETTRYAGLGRQEREPIEGDDHFVIFGCYRFSCDVSTGSARRRRWIEPGLGRSQQQDVIFTAKATPADKGRIEAKPRIPRVEERMILLGHLWAVHLSGGHNDLLGGVGVVTVEDLSGDVPDVFGVGEVGALGC